jgi:NADH-quinone oxidoreductase subunit J
MVDTAVFVVCAAIVLIGAIGVVVSRHPVHSALSLVATLFGVAVLFLEQNAQLLAAVQVIVYTGAIVVLILFVIMLLGVDQEEDLSTEPLVAQRALAGIAGVALLVSLILVFLPIAHDRDVTGKHSTEAPLSTHTANIVQVGKSLFTTWIFPFEITAGLLTIAVIGAVVLSRRPDSYEPMPEPEPMTDESIDLLAGSEEVAP